MYTFGLAGIEVKWFWIKLRVILTLIGLFLFPFYLFYNDYIKIKTEPHKTFITKNEIMIIGSTNDFPIYGKKIIGEKNEFYSIYPNFYLKSDFKNCPDAETTNELTWCQDFLVRYLYTGETQDLRSTINKFTQ